MTSIVCGVDDSREARVALRFAADLAELFGVRLVAAHVVRPPAPTLGIGMTAREPVNVPAEALLSSGEALLDRILEDEDLSDVERRVALGFPPDRLADLAREEAAELIVVGSRGRGAFKAALLGSFSTRLLAVAGCPVLVVPARAGASAGDAKRRELV
ncbi:MAG TPA: universal stress protein [Gaiellaceae bacterium]|jgi:nucleotide-binding universal stress UspA family protein|nr:universal stress protein [Gaiellaceae bacterium]